MREEKGAVAPLNFRGRHDRQKSKHHSTRKEAAAPLLVRDVAGWGEQGTDGRLHIGFQKKCSCTIVREECFLMN